MSWCYQSFIDRLPLFYVFLSGVGFSMQALVIKILSEYGYRASLHCVLTRGLLQCLLSCLFMYFQVDLPPGNEKPPKLFGNSNYIRLMLFLRSVVGFGSIASGYIAIEYIPVGDSTVLVMLSPMIAAVLGYFILGEPWRIPEFIGTIMSLTGAIFVARPPFIFGEGNTDNVDPKRFYIGVFIALFASCNAAGAFIFVRILGTTAKMPWPYVTFSQSLAQIFLSPILMYALKIPVNQKFTWPMMLLIFCGGFIGSWSQAAMTIGMQREKSASATAMRMSDVVFGFIWQASFTTDKINKLAIIGAILVSTSILVVVIWKPPPSPTATQPSAGIESTNVNSDPIPEIDNQIEMIDFSISENLPDIPKRSVKEIIATNLREMTLGVKNMQNPLHDKQDLERTNVEYSKLALDDDTA